MANQDNIALWTDSQVTEWLEKNQDAVQEHLRREAVPVAPRLETAKQGPALSGRLGMSVPARPTGTQHASKVQPTTTTKEVPGRLSAHYLAGMAEAGSGGLAFGFGDEMIVGNQALHMWLLDLAKNIVGEGSAKSLPETYRKLKREWDARQAKFRGDYPVDAFAAEFAGSMPGGGLVAKGAGRLLTAGRRALPSGSLATAPGYLSRTGTQTAIGAGEGALEGYGTSEEGKESDSALGGGVVGGVLSQKVPFLGDIMGFVSRKFLNMFRSGDGRVRAQTHRAVMDVADLKKTTPEEVVRQLQSDPEMTLGDIRSGSKVEPMLDRVEDYSIGGDTSLPDQFRSRAKAVERRTQDDAANIFPEGRVTTGEAVSSYMDEMSKTARDAYKKAYAEFPRIPVSQNPELERLMSEGGEFEKAFEFASRLRRSEGPNARPLTPETAGLDDWHFVRRVLDRDAYKSSVETPAGAAGIDTQIARNLRNRLNAFLIKYTDSRSQGINYFKVANQRYASSAARKEAALRGMTAHTDMASTVREAIESLPSQGEKSAYRVAALDRLYSQIGMVGEEGDMYSRMFKQQEQKDKISALFGGESTDGYRKYEKLIRRESVFYDTFLAAKKGANSSVDNTLFGHIKGLVGDIFSTPNPNRGAVRAFLRWMTWGSPTAEMKKEMSRLMSLKGDAAYRSVMEIIAKKGFFLDDPERLRDIGNMVSGGIGILSGQAQAGKHRYPMMTEDEDGVRKYNSLPPGAYFRTPDGTLKIKGAER